MIKTLNKLDINTDKPFVLSIGSLAGVGKTSIMCSFAGELLNNGKSVLIITEDSEPNIIRRLSKIVNSNSKTKCLVKKYWHFLPEIFDIETFFSNLDYEYEYVFLDLPFLEPNFVIQIVDYFKNKNSSVIITQQLRNYVYDLSIIDFPITKITHISDYVISVGRRKVFTLIERIKYFLFGIEKPNLFLKVIKNRKSYEKEKTIYFDFETLKIR